MASSQPNTTTTTTTRTKPSTRRRKIEIKKVEQTNKRHVTFSKRKLGLFNKVTELSILCQAETALIVTSQNGKLYTCGYPNPDAVIRRYLTRGFPQKHGKRKRQESGETLRLQYEAILNQLKEEKKQLLEITEAKKANSFSFPPWWIKSVEDMGLEDLEHFIASIEYLKLNLVAAAEGKMFNSSPSHIVPLAIVPPPTFSNLSLLNNGW